MTPEDHLVNVRVAQALGWRIAVRMSSDYPLLHDLVGPDGMYAATRRTEADAWSALPCDWANDPALALELLSSLPWEWRIERTRDGFRVRVYNGTVVLGVGCVAADLSHAVTEAWLAAQGQPRTEEGCRND